MTRPGSREHARQPTQRTPAGYTTDAIPPPDLPVLVCWCGGRYRDHPASEAAHRAVFGHNPIRKPAPPAGESAPEQHHEEGASA
jgi:hypothetical protein